MLTVSEENKEGEYSNYSLLVKASCVATGWYGSPAVTSSRRVGVSGGGLTGRQRRRAPVALGPPLNQQRTDRLLTR